MRSVVIELESDTEIQRVGVRIGRETLWLEVTGTALPGESNPSWPDDEAPHILSGDLPLSRCAPTLQEPAEHKAGAGNSLAQIIMRRKLDAQRSKAQNEA